MIPYVQAEELWMQALETGTPIQLYSFENVGHGVRITRRVGANQLIEYMRQFSSDVVNGQPIETFRIDI